MIDTFKDRIFSTGGENESFLFKTLIINDDELKEIENNTSLKDFAKSLNIDFICIKRIGTINFLHVTDIKNKSSINKKGLVFTDTHFIYDLGNGIYSILDTKDCFYDGMESLKDYIAEHTEVNKILVVTGEYTGEYIECVYGVGHKGYIVMYNNVSADKINNIESVKMSTFLYND